MPRPLLALLLLTLLALGTMWGLARDPRTAGAEEPKTKRPQSDYVGSKACATCHKKEHDLWKQSSHAHTLEPALASNMPDVVVRGGRVEHQPGATQFHAGKDGFHAETLAADGTPHRFPLTHVVGRMRIRMFVATLEDGRHQVLPGMLEVPRDTWFDYSHLIFGGPGSDPDTPPIIKPGTPSFWTGPVRSFGARCAACHATNVQPVEPIPGKPYGARATWSERGVGCETCHGPGRAHTEAWQKFDTSKTLPRIEKLPTNVANDICLRCHIEHEVVAPANSAQTDLLEEFDPTLLIDPSRVDPAGRPLELIYEGLPFLTSRCAKEGDLRCIDCHDGHGGAHRGQLRASKGRDGLCVRCHEPVRRDLAAHAHHAVDGAGARCTNCHMPALTIERGHGAVADHSIGIPRLGLEADRAATDACTWCHQGGLRAPKGAPKLDAAALQKAYAAWWPSAGEPPAWVRALAAARLGKKGAASALLGVLEDGDARRVVRASAARLLGRVADAPLERILEACRDEDSLVRRSALYGLGGRQGKDVDAALLAALRDPSAPVRRVAAHTALEGWTRVQKNRPLLDAVLPVLVKDCEAAPNDDMRWFRLGAAREIAGDTKGAIAAYARQVMLDPFASNIRAHLERLRKR